MSTFVELAFGETIVAGSIVKCPRCLLESYSLSRDLAVGDAVTVECFDPLDPLYDTLKVNSHMTCPAEGCGEYLLAPAGSPAGSFGLYIKKTTL